MLAQSPLPPSGTAWIATPVHLLAGLTSVHLPRAGVLRLAPAEAQRLALDFGRTFEGSGFKLTVLPPADLLLVGPPFPEVKTVEPARAALGSLKDAQPRGKGAELLRRLGAEIEMWLYAHPLNSERARVGMPAVSALWPWGGGPMPIELRSSAQPSAVVFATDAATRGLLNLNEMEARQPPDTLGEALGYAEAERAALVLASGSLLQTHPEWTLIEAVTQLDTDLIAPAVAALRRGKLARLVLIANDRVLAVRRRDLRRWWRRRRPPLPGLAR
jgi:hypothetical protein